MKQVYISCAFWDDDWINELDPSEKLFYLYLITTTNNNLIGVYKMPKKKICYDTGFSMEIVKLLLERFENQYKKIYYIDDHIFLKNMVKNQALNSPKLVLGMKNTLNNLPDKLKILFLLEIAKQGYWSVFKGVSIPYGYPMDTLSVQYGYSMDTVRILCDTPPVNINLNQNLNQNIKSKSSNQKENLKENENTLCDCVADDDDDDLKDNLKTDDDDDSGIGESKAVLLDHGISGNTAKIILDKFVPEYVIFKIRQIDDMNKSGQIKNLKAYILKTFENTDQDTADNELCAFLSEERRKEEARKPKMNPELERMKKQQEQDEKFIQETEILVLNATEKDKQTFIETVIEPSNMYKQSFNRGGFENGFVSVLFRTFLQNKYKEAK